MRALGACPRNASSLRQLGTARCLSGHLNQLHFSQDLTSCRLHYVFSEHASTNKELLRLPMRIRLLVRPCQTKPAVVDCQSNLPYRRPFAPPGTTVDFVLTTGHHISLDPPVAGTPNLALCRLAERLELWGTHSQWDDSPRSRAHPRKQFVITRKSAFFRGQAGACRDIGSTPEATPIGCYSFVVPEPSGCPCRASKHSPPSSMAKITRTSAASCSTY
jgi:hypothetical protein